MRRRVTRTRQPVPESLRWPLALLVTLLVAGLLPLAWEGRYYYSGDSQTAYVGWWFRLGEQLRHGHWPLLDVQSWRAGNAAAEGQWGLFSPLSLGIAVLTSVSSNVVVVTSVVKVALVLVCGLGVYLLARSYRVPAPAAYVAGLLAPLSGQAQYGDWASWGAGVMVTALLPWAWWAIRRLMLDDTGAPNPLPALLACYLLVTIGYVYGTLYLILVITGCLLECLLTRNRTGLLRVVGVGVCSGLVAVTVYLPGVLTSPVTIRSNWGVEWKGVWTVDPLALLSSMLPVAVVNGRLGGGRYVVWLLPLLAWVGGHRLRARWRELSALLFTTAVLLAWVLGPNRMGPIRWPMRVLPAFTLVLVLLLVVLLARTMPPRPSPLRLLVSLAWVAVAWCVVTVRLGGVEWGTVAGALAVGAAVSVVWVALRQRGVRLAAAVAGLSTVVLLLVQHSAVPDPPSVDRHMPARVAGYRGQLSGAVGDTIMVGNPGRPWQSGPGAARELLVGSTWYLNRHPVHNAGTAISFQAYSKRFCMMWSGVTCHDALDRLFEREPRTGERWVRLMSVSTVLIVRRTYGEGRLAHPPPGWHVGTVGRWSVTWVRDVPLPTAGGVVATSPGTTVGDVSSTDRHVSFRVDDVPAEGGRVVLSRLAWPGYRAEGGTLGRPLAHTLLTVRVPGDARGGVVTLSWSPPGWRLELLCWWVGVGAAVSWSAVALRRRRLRRQPGPGHPHHGEGGRHPERTR